MYERVQSLWRTVWEFLIKLKYIDTIPQKFRSNYVPESTQHLYVWTLGKNIYKSFAYNRQKQNTMSINRSMIKLVHSGNEMPLKNSKEWATDTYNNTRELHRHYLSRRVHIICFRVFEVLEQEQRTYGDKWQNRGYLWGLGYWLERDMKKSSGVREVFHILIWVLII